MNKFYNLRGLKVHNAAETTFATAEGSFSGWDIRAIENTINVQCLTDHIDDPTVQTSVFDQWDPIYGLQNKSKLTFSTFFRSTGTAAGNSTAALGKANRVEGLLLATCMGGESLGTGTTVTGSSSTTTHIDCTSTAGLTVGQAVMIGGEAATIASKTATEIILDRALTSAPSAATVVYASATYYVDPTATATLQFQVRGDENDYRTLLGCKGGFTFSDMNPGQLPKINWDFHVTAWTATATGAALSAASFDNSADAPVVGSAGKLYLQDNGTTTISGVHAATVQINPGLTFVPNNSTSGIQGTQAWVMSACKPTFSLTADYSDDYRLDWVGSTAKYIHYQIGSTAGYTVLVDIQKAYFNPMPTRANLNSQLGVKVDGKAVAGAATTKLTESPIRIHLI